MAEFIKTYIHKIEKQFKKASAGMRTLRSGGSNGVRLNGTRLVIRPPVPADVNNLLRMHRRLSKETLYFRYLTLYQPGIKDMQAVCDMPPSEGAALVAQRNDTDGTIIGLAYYRFDRSYPDGRPEFAIVVEDGFQGRGVGKALLKRLCRSAAALGLKTLNASIHPQNRRMRHLLWRTDYPFDEHEASDTVEAAIHLQPGPAAGPRRSFGNGRLADPFAGLDLELIL
ncbi:hypothetical protein DSCA_35990 [Desulfosarcina alkanivorans]|uniref:N-acetyltransferase domain-containing protein n=1 Tax=Desulfosarcina alkanivorans TaxID=571177 RepID=A0A5K7YP78_9BACT|nr:GNAT family N-acetyltransferase [Desulfosarcina alkanivorans]BBO69669.1 hypothetical protein DSCA_35990 [Desulfosarcina alkanivorans]